MTCKTRQRNLEDQEDNIEDSRRQERQKEGSGEKDKEDKNKG